MDRNNDYLPTVRLNENRCCGLLCGCLIVTAAHAVGCSEQKIVEPNRDDFIDGEVETTIGPNKGPSDEEDSKYVK